VVRLVKVKVTARSNIRTSFCGGRRHPHSTLLVLFALPIAQQKRC